MPISIKQFRYILIIAISLIFTSCNQETTKVSKIEMDLSSFGVESDNYPTIHASINLSADSSYCKKIYYSPKHNDSTYSLTKNEIEKIKDLLSQIDLEKIKKNYDVTQSDQPTSTIKFYKNNNVITIKDYGLIGDYPLQDLYKIVYKF